MTSATRAALGWAAAGAGAMALGAATATSPRLTLLGLLGVLLLLWLTSLRRVLPLIADLWTRMRWWQLLWLLLFMSGLVYRARTTSSAGSNPLDSAALSRIGL